MCAYPSYHQGFYQKLVFQSVNRVSPSASNYATPEYRNISLPQNLAETHYLKVKVVDANILATESSGGDWTHIHIELANLQPLNQSSATATGLRSESRLATCAYQIDTQSHGKYYNLQHRNDDDDYLLFRFEDWNNATIQFELRDGSDGLIITPNQGAENYCITLGFTAVPRNETQPII